MSGSVQIDPLAVDAYLNDIDGPVGDFLAEAAAKASAVAKAAAPVMKGKNYWTERSNAVRPPGLLKASVHPHGPAYDSAGKLFASANSLFDPGYFQEKGSGKYPHMPHPFLTVGLFAAMSGLDL